MRNRGKKDYLKPVHHDILLIELMYYVFSFVAPRAIKQTDKSAIPLPNSINFRDILAVLLTSKNWHNLFKNYTILTMRNMLNTRVYGGFKTSVNAFSRIDKINNHVNKPWYRSALNYNLPDNIFILNNRLTGCYNRVILDNRQSFAISFRYLTQIAIYIRYTDIYSVIYYPIDKSKFKYILHAKCVNNTIENVFYVTYDLPADHPDRAVIDRIIKIYQLFT